MVTRSGRCGRGCPAFFPAMWPKLARGDMAGGYVCCKLVHNLLQSRLSPPASADGEEAARLSARRLGRERCKNACQAGGATRAGGTAANQEGSTNGNPRAVWWVRGGAALVLLPHCVKRAGARPETRPPAVACKTWSSCPLWTAAGAAWLGGGCGGGGGDASAGDCSCCPPPAGAPGARPPGGGPSPQTLPRTAAAATEGTCHGE